MCSVLIDCNHAAVHSLDAADEADAALRERGDFVECVTDIRAKVSACRHAVRALMQHTADGALQQACYGAEEEGQEEGREEEGLPLLLRLLEAALEEDPPLPAPQSASRPGAAFPPALLRRCRRMLAAHRAEHSSAYISYAAAEETMESSTATSSSRRVQIESSSSTTTSATYSDRERGQRRPAETGAEVGTGAGTGDQTRTLDDGPRGVLEVEARVSSLEAALRASEAALLAARGELAESAAEAARLRAAAAEREGLERRQEQRRREQLLELEQAAASRTAAATAEARLGLEGRVRELCAELSSERGRRGEAQAELAAAREEAARAEALQAALDESGARLCAAEAEAEAVAIERRSEYETALRSVRAECESAAEAVILLAAQTREQTRQQTLERLGAGEAATETLRAQLLACGQRAQQWEARCARLEEAGREQQGEASAQVDALRIQLADARAAGEAAEQRLMQERSKQEELYRDTSSELAVSSSTVSEYALKCEHMETHYEQKLLELEQAAASRTAAAAEGRLGLEGRVRELCAELSSERGRRGEAQAELAAAREEAARAEASRAAEHTDEAHTREAHDRLAFALSVQQLGAGGQGQGEGPGQGEGEGPEGQPGSQDGLAADVGLCCVQSLLSESNLSSHHLKVLIDPKLFELMKLQEVAMLNHLVRKTDELNQLRKEISELKNKELAEGSREDDLAALAGTCEALQEEGELQRARFDGRLALFQAERLELEKRIAELQDILRGERSLCTVLREDVAQSRREKGQLQQRLASLLRGQLVSERQLQPVAKGRISQLKSS
jgi:hypothetical protein